MPEALWRGILARSGSPPEHGKEDTRMTLVDERLTVRKSRAHVRFVEDFTFALKEAEPSKAALEDALKDKISHGRRLLEMAEVACYLASVKQLQTDTNKDMEWALTMGVRAFR